MPTIIIWHKQSAIIMVLLLSACICVGSPVGAVLPGAGAAAPAMVQAQDLLRSRPLSFIPNQGQASPEVAYYALGSTHAVMLTPQGVVMRLPAAGRLHTLKLTPVGSNLKAKLIPVDLQAGKANHFKGRDPEKWRTNLPTYGAVLYREAYPGIDLKVYGTGCQLEYDVIIRPGADPSRVRFRASGGRRLTVNDQGDLVLSLPGGGAITQKKPVVYQEIDGCRVPREGRFQVAAGRTDTYGFALDPYDSRYPLVIDPLVAVYAVTLGGTTPPDRGQGIAVDQDGNVYVTGYTYSTDFPTTPGAYDTVLSGYEDAFVTKLGPDGAILASTFLGGGGYDEGRGIALDPEGNVYVAGTTDSGNFPTTPGAYDATLNGSVDIFVAKLNNSLSALSFATYLGGSGSEFGDAAIAVNQSGEAFVTGFTASTNFPAPPPAYKTTKSGDSDAFVTRFYATGSGLVYSTYLGGGGYETGHGIAVDRDNRAYVIGSTESGDFPQIKSLQGKSGPNDAFVTCLNDAGTALVYSTYLGGSGQEYGQSIAVDGTGAAYVCGHTTSTDFPRQNAIREVYGGGDSDGFVAKLALAGDALALVYSTYLGGNGDEEANGIAVDQEGAAYVTGSTYSADFPLVDPLPGVSWPSGFLTKLNPGGTAWVYSTPLGIGGRAVAVDHNGLASVVGGSSGSQCGVIKVRHEATAVLTVNLTSLSASCLRGKNAASQYFTVRNTGIGTLSYNISVNALWITVDPLSGDSTGEEDSITVNYATKGLAPGKYNAAITISAPGAINTPQIIGVTLEVKPTSIAPTMLLLGN